MYHGGRDECTGVRIVERGHERRGCVVCTQIRAMRGEIEGYIVVLVCMYMCEASLHASMVMGRKASCVLDAWASELETWGTAEAERNVCCALALPTIAHDVQRISVPTATGRACTRFPI